MRTAQIIIQASSQSIDKSTFLIKIGRSMLLIRPIGISKLIMFIKAIRINIYSIIIIILRWGFIQILFLKKLTLILKV